MREGWRGLAFPCLSISIYLDSLQAAQIRDATFADGEVGTTKIGAGRKVKLNLRSGARLG